MNDEELLNKLATYKFYHVIPLTEKISTPGVEGFVPLNAPVYRLMDQLNFRGKRVLGIGCRDGLFSFYSEKRGASEIIGVDTCLSLGAVEFLIPYFDSKVRMHEVSLLDLNPEKWGIFDVILFLGVLYHLRYPFQALKIISDLMPDGGKLLIETAIFADRDKRALLFCPIGKDQPYDRSSTTFFNRKGLVDTLTSFGLRVDATDYVTDRDRRRTDESIIRGSFLCTKDTALSAAHPHNYWSGGKHMNWTKR
jgi:SAM-dependent methyltransferase